MIRIDAYWLLPALAMAGSFLLALGVATVYLIDELTTHTHGPTGNGGAL